MKQSKNSFKTLQPLKVAGSGSYQYFNLTSLPNAAQVARLPFSIRILLENLLRHEEGVAVKAADIEKVIQWNPQETPDYEIAFMPARVVLQDFTGVPAVVDLAAMRHAVAKMGGDPKKINPLLPAELVIDHSVQVDAFGNAQAFAINSQLEYERNRERYMFLRWGQTAFNNFKVVPPETGIVHQVNLENLARTVMEKDGVAYPDTVIGTDSHTTMINGLGVLGWGVGGIEAEAAMLGQPMSMLLPQVVGMKLTGSLREGATATDLVLTITQMLRKHGVVNKFVEFFGPGLRDLPLADRATIANMAPEYGATCGIFPVDQETLNYLKFTGRDEKLVALVSAYYQAQGMFLKHDGSDLEPQFSSTLSLDLSTVEPCLAGPKRPQDRLVISAVKKNFADTLAQMVPDTVAQKATAEVSTLNPQNQKNSDFKIQHGSVVIAAITSCTNTSNPSVLIAAGLVAKKAVERGLQRRPWVKTSLAPGSKVVTGYLQASGLLTYLDQIGFNVVGYGCTTCIGNSGPLPSEISKAVQDKNLVVAAVLSGNRNFEGRVNPDVRANYLASPPLVVAYALAGRVDFDPQTEPVGHDKNGAPIFLRDLWPTNQEIQTQVQQCVKTQMFKDQYRSVFSGDTRWQQLPVPKGDLYQWDTASTYIRLPNYFDKMAKQPSPISGLSDLRVLAVLGDSITTDHISPAGNISEKSPAGQYLVAQGIAKKDFNSYGARRGNHEVMIRGTFANIRLRNSMVPQTEGGYSCIIDNPQNPQSAASKPVFIYDAAVAYEKMGTPLMIIAGKEYGSGSSRDWAAKGTRLLGVRTVLAESYERIHRSNLVGMGVLPLEFMPGENRTSLGLSGFESFSIEGLSDQLTPKQTLTLVAKLPGQADKRFKVLCRIDTPNEIQYYRHGGILPFVLRSLID